MDKWEMGNEKCTQKIRSKI